MSALKGDELELKTIEQQELQCKLCKHRIDDSTECKKYFVKPAYVMLDENKCKYFTQ